MSWPLEEGELWEWPVLFRSWPLALLWTVIPERQLSGEDGNGGSGSAWTAADRRTGSSQVGDELGTSSEAVESKGTLDSAERKGLCWPLLLTKQRSLEDRTQAFIGNGATVDAGRDVISITARRNHTNTDWSRFYCRGEEVSVWGGPLELH